MEEKETALEDIPTERYPTLSSTVNELIQRIRDTTHQVSKERHIQLEISPAELISYLLFHALKFKLSKQPQHLGLCCQSILNHIPDFVDSVATDRKQAIEHAKKKALIHQQEQQKNASTDNTATTSEAKIPTPPTSPSVEKKTVTHTNDGDGEDKQQVQDTSS